MAEIYLIKNKLNNKCYIGKTKYTGKSRFDGHIKASKVKTNNKFHNAIQKYGSNNFELIILEKDVPIDKLNELEMLYIEKYNSFHNGYNSTLGGKGIFNYRHTTETKIKISLSNKKKDYSLMVDRNRKISKFFRGRPKSKEHRKKLSDVAKKRVGCLNSFFGKSHSQKTRDLISNANSIPILMYRDDELIKEFKNVDEASAYIKEKLKLEIKLASISTRIRRYESLHKEVYGYLFKKGEKVKCLK